MLSHIFIDKLVLGGKESDSLMKKWAEWVQSKRRDPSLSTISGFPFLFSSFSLPFLFFFSSLFFPSFLEPVSI